MARPQMAEEEEHPEDLTRFPCHDPNRKCGISLDNDVSLFLFHGQTETYFKEIKDAFGDAETVYDTRYTHPVRQVFQLIDSVFSDAQLPKVDDGRKPKTNPLNANFQKKEFQELWVLLWWDWFA